MEKEISKEELENFIKNGVTIIDVRSKQEYEEGHLNDAILKEAKIRGIKRLYLKTTLDNYYEKFGAKYLETLANNEKIYYFEI